MQEKTLKVESSRGASIVDVTGYGPQCAISPVTNEVVVYIPGIPEAVARLPHGARDIIVTRNGALLYRSVGGGVGHAWCDQHLRVASIVRALDTTCRSERGLEVVPVANPVDNSAVVVKADTSYEERVKQLKAEVLERREKSLELLKGKPAPRAREVIGIDSSRLDLFRIDPRAREVVPSSDEIEWTQAGGLRDNLVAVRDNPFVRR